MQVLKCAGCAGVATGSILVYAYILIYCFKNQAFEKEGFEVESFFRPPTTTFEGRQDDGIKLLSIRQLKKFGKMDFWW
jgi:hypothetical protein